ncbi:MAG: cell division protein ZapA [Candidatus Cloacimonadota bacterium]|nr:MAG: cell division protein ZapA [Candidatus Cloacimonadota bacterium]
MEKKENVVTFNILGEQYTVKTDLDKDTTVHVARFVNRQIEEVSKKSGYASQTKIAVLAALNIALELFHEKNMTITLEQKIEQACKKLRNVLSEE